MNKRKFTKIKWKFSKIKIQSKNFLNKNEEEIEKIYKKLIEEELENLKDLDLSSPHFNF